MQKRGGFTLSSFTRLNYEQVLTYDDSVLLIHQKLDNFSGFWCVYGDIDLDAILAVTNDGGPK